MKHIAWLFKWLLKAAIFFTLFAFALNNQGDVTLRFFFGYQWTTPMVLVVLCATAVTVMALAAAVTGNLFVAAVAALITSGASAIAKASLDASLQDDLPEESRASAFGRSESVLQLAWVTGGALGVLVYTELWVGFTAITALLIPCLAQTILSFRGASLIPGLGGNRPVMVDQEGGAWSPTTVMPKK